MKLSELHAKLVDAVTQLTDDDDWKAVLGLRAKFHRYSFTNILLMWAQRPNVTAVAGYQQWRERFQRQVLAGETAMKIYNPIFKEDEDGETRLVTFGIVNVFDVTQTQAMCPECRATFPYRQADRDKGKRRGGWLTDDERTQIEDCRLCGGTGLDPADPPLPSALDFADERNADGPEGLWPALQVVSQGIGFGLPSLENMGGGMENGHPDGMCNHAAKTITIERALPEGQQAKTLVHELAHALMHAPDDPAHPKDRGLVEIEAESVAYLVCQSLGFTSPDYSFPYIAHWARSDPKAVEKVGNRAIEYAEVLLALIAAAEPALAVAA